MSTRTHRKGRLVAPTSTDTPRSTKDSKNQNTRNKNGKAAPPTPGTRRRPGERGRLSPPNRARPGARVRRTSRWATILPIALVVLVVATFGVVKLSMGSNASAPRASTIGGGAALGTGSGTTPLPRSVEVAATSVGPAVLRSVGIPDGVTRPIRVAGQRPLLVAADGKPELLYVGSEFCPFCAAQRWGLVVALSRFGTFSGLRATHSSLSDEFPGTETFSFFGSAYTSPYLDFVPVELQTDVAVNGTYPTLQRLSPGQQSLLDAYDRAPYSPEAGAIPFLDLGNRFVMVGAGYNPAVLQGMRLTQIASALSHPRSAVAQGVDGTANALTAAICQMTGGQPGSVCGVKGSS
jgi:hypothetical protein